MKKSLVLALCLVLAITMLTVAGCGSKKAAEKTAEKIIEKATNGQANVDLSTNSVTINTNTGSYAVGGNVSLPTGFPDDVYVIDGTLTSSSTDKVYNSYSVIIQTEKSVTEAQQAYETQLSSKGWTMAMNTTSQGAVVLDYTKDNRNVSVTIMTVEGKTSVSVVVSTQASN